MAIRPVWFEDVAVRPRKLPYDHFGLRALDVRPCGMAVRPFGLEGLAVRPWRWPYGNLLEGYWSYGQVSGRTALCDGGLAVRPLWQGALVRGRAVERAR